MNRLIDHTSLFETDTGLVLRILHAWQPSSQDGIEKDHEQDLHTWLRKCVPNVPTIAQYGIARGKADLVIEDKHLIELKLAFSADNLLEFQRCLGQLECYRQKWVEKDRGSVYLVIVGESDSEFRDILHTWFEKANEPYFFTRFHLLEKEIAQLAAAS